VEQSIPKLATDPDKAVREQVNKLIPMVSGQENNAG
jgi:hypothetical protein